MTISKRIHSQLFASNPPAHTSDPTASPTAAAAAASPENAEKRLIRLPLNHPRPGAPKRASRAKTFQSRQNGLGWTDEEHERFLHGLELFPTGPWKEVAAFVGTRTTRQTMTHAQKYRQKIMRRQRGLMIPVRKSAVGGGAVSASAVVAADSVAAAGEAKTIETVSDTVVSIAKDASVSTPASTAASSTTSSPSSSEQLVGDFDFHIGCHEFEANFHSAHDPALMMTMAMSASDEYRSSCMDEGNFFPNELDESMFAMLNDVEDPVAVMFEDPNSYPNSATWQHKAMALSTINAYPSQWTTVNMADPFGMAYECQL